MADRKDRKDSRPIPPPPGRAVPPGDPELEAASDDVTAEERRASAKRKREQFAQARTQLVDIYVASSNGALTHSAFNGIPLDQFDDVAAEHGFQPFHHIAEENATLRNALGAEIAGKHRHVDLGDLGDVLDPGRPFDLEQANAAADQIEAQRGEQARELLASALAEVGIDTSAEDFDAVEVLRRAAVPPKSAEGELPAGAVISTPASRAANLPAGRPPSLDKPSRYQDGPEGALTGTDAIEVQAREDLAKWGI